MGAGADEEELFGREGFPGAFAFTDDASSTASVFPSAGDPGFGGCEELCRRGCVGCRTRRSGDRTGWDVNRGLAACAETPEPSVFWKRFISRSRAVASSDSWVRSRRNKRDRNLRVYRVPDQMVAISTQNENAIIIRGIFRAMETRGK